MQIRLTVALESRGGGQGSGNTGTSSCEVLVTAPAGTVLAAVTGALASTAAASAGGGEGTIGDSVQDSVAVYAGTERLDPHRQMIGEPPLLDGAVVSLHGPSAPAAVPAYGSARARLHVTAGPDAGGIHLLQGGNVRLGRSADADVPLDDPDVSRMHCTVTVTDGGDVTVTDLGSTNGTWLDGTPVGGRPVLFRPGATLALGESAVRLEAAAPAGQPPTVPALPDGNGRVRLAPPADGAPGRTEAGAATASSAAPSQPLPSSPAPPRMRPSADGHSYPAAADSAHSPFPQDDGTHGAGLAGVGPHSPGPSSASPGDTSGSGRPAGDGAETEHRRARGLGAWARRFAGGRSEGASGQAGYAAGPAPGAGGIPGRGTAPVPGTGSEPGGSTGAVGGQPQQAAGATGFSPGRWDDPLPDPATVLLTALGPGPRLWEREPGHPDALTVRLGSAHSGTGRPGEPVTVDLRSAGALGLAGPRTRLAGLARSVLAQLTAMHGPSTLEVVLLAGDRSSTPEARSAEWAWLGWLPHLRPAHGQDCRLLTAYDHDQATARTAELTRRLDEERRVSGGGTGPRPGPYTVLVVDGDPGTPSLRDSVARLAAEGPAAGIHVLALAEAPPATPASPLAATTETAYTASPAFRQCGTLALLSGAVATAVRVVRRDPAAPAASNDAAAAAGGAVATVDAVSAAWAERFARALAPLREAEGTAARTGTTSQPVVTLPRSARLLDELGLARATPAALLARWSEPDSAEAGRARLVFGAGPRGPVEAELTAARRHALITGPAGTGKTELLRSLAASLAAGERPDRLRLLLLDGDGDAAHEGLHVCVELPHVTGHLAAGDPVRMREFAQSITSELKRRAELIGDHGTYEEYTRSGGRPAPRVITPRSSPESGRTPAAGPGADPQPGQGAGTAGAGDLVSDATRGTLRLRPRGQREDSGAEPGGTGANGGRPDVDGADGRLPRIVLLVDDLDTLVEPALGNPGRPAAGSVIRALESVTREGARLGMHLVAATGRPERMSGTAAARIATAELQAELTATTPEGDHGDEETVPGRGVLRTAGGAATAFQSGRVTGRIPRTATQRPTVVPLDWTRAGDPPTRRPVRELGNGPTDLALLASATVRAAQSLGTEPAAAGAGGSARSRSGQEGALDS